MRTMVIAEAGACHNGNESWATELAYVAKASGADAVKFQYIGDVASFAKRRKALAATAMYQRYALPAAWLPGLKAAATHVGIKFGCTAFQPQDVAVVEPFADFFKVSSFEAQAADLIAAHVPFLDGKRTLYISLGMGGDYDAAISALGASAKHAEFLHCVSSYPAPTGELNLRRMLSGSVAMTGFSDHSGNVLTGALAVAAGAKVVEAHLRLDCTSPENPDYPHALSPERFAEYVRNIRAAESAMGTGEDTVQPSEQGMLAYRVAGDDTDGEAAAEGEGGGPTGPVTDGRPARRRRDRTE